MQNPAANGCQFSPLISLSVVKFQQKSHGNLPENLEIKASKIPSTTSILVAQLILCAAGTCPYKGIAKL